jgi:hypothetical protein
MHREARRRPHADPGIEDVDPVVTLGVEAVELRSRAHAGDDRLASHQIQPGESTNRVGRTQRIDAVPYAKDCARLYMGGKRLPRHHR